MLNIIILYVMFCYGVNVISDIASFKLRKK